MMTFYDETPYPAECYDPPFGDAWKAEHNRRAMEETRKTVELHMRVGAMARASARARELETRPQAISRWVREHQVTSTIVATVSFAGSVTGLIAGIGAIWPW